MREPEGFVGSRTRALALVVASTLLAAAALAVSSAPPAARAPDAAGRGAMRVATFGSGGASPIAVATSVPASDDGRDLITYGLVEPATALPGVETPADRAAWSQIRTDVVESGACWLRSDVNAWLARAIDTLDWLGGSTPCTGAPGSSVKLLAILDDQTVWDASLLCPGVAFSAAYRTHHADFTLDDWRALVRCVTRRFVGRISAYEIWNEPVLPDSRFGYEDGSPEHYLRLLEVAYQEVKLADPRATVIALGGSDLYAGGDLQRLALMRSFSVRLVGLGARRYADAVSVHAYPWGRADSSVWASYERELVFEQQTWRRPVWVTETGQRASDQLSQSAYMQVAYALFIGLGIRHLFWFSITDQRDGDFGLRSRPLEPSMRAFTVAHP